MTTTRNRLERLKKELQRADSDFWTFNTQDVDWLVQQADCLEKLTKHTQDLRDALGRRQEEVKHLRQLLGYTE